MSDSPPRRFLIVTTARSGSNQLVDYINQTDTALCLGEIFKESYWQLPDDNQALIGGCFGGVALAERELEIDPVAYWDRIVRVLGTHRALGAKLFYEHRVGSALWDELFERGTLIIHLWRNPILESFLSLVRAELTNEWVIRDAGAAARPPPVWFDASRYRAYREFTRERFEAIRRRQGAAGHYVEVEYGMMRRKAELAHLLDALFSARGNYVETLVKQAPADLLENVVNPGDAEPYVGDRLDPAVPSSGVGSSESGGTLATSPNGS